MTDPVTPKPQPNQPQAGKVTNNAKANDLLARQYRKGWTLDG
jgi:hypothetical protein